MNFLHLLFFPLVILLWPLTVSAEWHEQRQSIMGTSVQVRIWHPQARQAELAIAEVMAEMERINQLMSPYIESSELSLLNREAARREVTVSSELFALLARSTAISEMSEGAFDITFASVGYLYQYREGTRPDQQQIEQSLGAINYQHVLLNSDEKTVRFGHADVRIDLGGIAKGYAVDLAYHILKERGIHHGYISAGGDSRLIGDRRGRPWMIGVKDPRNPQQQAVLLPLEDTAVSTSGDYERYFEDDGVRYHHIIHPETGRSAGEVQSVTILGPDATTTDAFSTTVFVLGVEKGLALVNSMPELDAIIIDRHRKMHYSAGLQSAKQ